MTIAGLMLAFVGLVAASAVALGIASMGNVLRRHFANAQLAHRMLKRERPARAEALAPANGRFHHGAA